MRETIFLGAGIPPRPEPCGNGDGVGCGKLTHPDTPAWWAHNWIPIEHRGQPYYCSQKCADRAEDEAE